MTLAIYPGSFDPFTIGHLYVVRRAAALFQNVVVLIGDNPEKNPLFTVRERLAMIRRAVRRFPNVRADATPDLIVSYARSLGATVLVRGVRNADDMQSESLVADVNWSLAPEIATVLLPAPPDVRDVSSSAVKARARHGESLDPFLAPDAAKRLMERVGGRS